MKKTIILTWLMLTMAFAASAAENGVFMEFHRMSNPGKHTQVNRAPMHLPIEVTYDTDAQTIKIVGDESIDAEVYIYQGDGWYAKGKILL